MEHHVIWYTGAIDSISWFLYHCTWPHILYRNLFSTGVTTMFTGLQNILQQILERLVLYPTFFWA
jgi:hypothetical protein